MHPARSLARASCNTSAGGGAPTARGNGLTTRSPRHGVLREVRDLRSDLLREDVVERKEVLENLQSVRRVCDSLGQEDAQQAAVRVAHRQRRAARELQARRAE